MAITSICRQYQHFLLVFFFFLSLDLVINHFSRVYAVMVLVLPIMTNATVVMTSIG